ncbi:PKD domain-containing protein [Aliikangiella coralliicola]|uniref:PKD domain-containing protein n=1 Tax=Aliikangiella coralliicola TaxID=2592383 RepID=A0A545UC26_9GAMM|nr:PKD domain-containing protein [Aliikangiella coralliicola]TQV87007.1 PKD domain-containing protein [Aliikangiella coralliicola]
MHNENGNETQAVKQAPPSLTCVNQHNRPCASPYSDNLSYMRANVDLGQWKIDHKIDLVVLLRQNPGPHGEDGSSYQLIKNETDNANWGYSTVALHENKLSGDYSTFDNIFHELGHLLGADHSEFNYSDRVSGQTAKAPSRAFLTHAKRRTNPSSKEGYYTIMAYYETALQHELDNPVPYVFDHYGIPRFSSPIGKFSYPVIESEYFSFGDATHDNLTVMASNAYNVSLYSNYLTGNLPPTARITKIGGQPYAINQTLTFSAKDSTDPDNDKLFYGWDLFKNGTRIAGVTNKMEFSYQFTAPGDYQLTLTVMDANAEKNSTNHKFSISLTAPVIKFDKRSSDFKISWDPVPGATSYRVYPRLWSNPWGTPWNQPNRSFVKLFSDMTDNVLYSYKVQACAGSECSGDSNIITIKDIGDGGDRPPGGRPCPTCSIP